MSTKQLTVKEIISKLKEKNKNPRKIFNRNELTLIVQALLSDKDYVSKNTSIKAGKLVTTDLHLSEQFKKGVTDILRSIGLNQKEAAEAAEKYKVPRSLASAIIDATHAADYLYMKEVGKGIKFIGDGDVDQTIFYREVGDKEHRIPESTRGGKASPYTRVKVKGHGRLGMKAKVNPSLKELLK